MQILIGRHKIIFFALTVSENPPTKGTYFCEFFMIDLGIIT